MFCIAFKRSEVSEVTWLWGVNPSVIKTTKVKAEAAVFTEKAARERVKRLQSLGYKHVNALPV